MATNQCSLIGFLIAVGVFLSTATATGSGKPHATKKALVGSRFVSQDRALIAAVFPFVSPGGNEEDSN